ncbi:MAG TPA: sugar ABC transporter substrate-binding protein [Acidimicrobiia bacterium]|nr:sugar ABC transporter substrate-binding protein [Acidimicrobiia bacterium]
MGRTRMKLYVLGTILALTAVACGGESGSTTAAGGGATTEPAEQLQLGYSAPFLFNEYSVVLQDSITAAAEAAGFEMLPPTNADSDSAQQNTDIRNLISAGADGLIVFANDSNAIVPALDFAEEQGVPVVAIDVGPDGGHVVMIVRVDNIGMGTTACDDMAASIGETGQALSLQGAATSINGRERSEGFAECMTQYPDIELIERPTDWDPEKQVAALQTVLTANPELSGVFQQSEYALEATNAVLTQAGFTAKVGEDGHIYNISIDATRSALDLVRDNTMDAAISQPIDLYASLGVQYLLGAINGETFGAGPTDHDTEIVDYNGNLMDLVSSVLVKADNVDDPGLWANMIED